MIALGLLGALMAVAWSLMGTFGSAEIRGWKLAHRVQTIRSAREWLESDMQHLALPVSPTVVNMPSMTKGSHFTGDSLGFTATIAPSIDPIPFLENLMSNTMGPERNSSDPMRSPPMQSSTMPSNFTPLGEPNMGFSAASDEPAPSTIWPADTIEIEYRLTPTAQSSVLPPRTMAGSGNTEDTVFVLTRRELADLRTTTTLENPSERVLSTEDLYGLSDDVRMSSRSLVREARLEGLTKVQFRYFDGSSWIAEWNSDQQGGLPNAIAFGFDFPAVSEMKPPSRASVERSEPESSLIDNGLSADLAMAGSGMDAETSQRTGQNNQGMMESSKNEVQIVVHVGNSVSKSKDTGVPSSQPDIP